MEAGDIVVNQEPGSPQAEAAEAALIEASFGQLMRRVGGLVDRSRALVGRTRSRLDEALRGAFFNAGESGSESESESESESADPASAGPFNPAHDSGFMQGVGLEEVLDSFYDFGRSVVEEFGAVVATKVLPEDFHQGPGEGRTQGKVHGPSTYSMLHVQVTSYTARCECDEPLQAVLKMCLF